MFEWEKVFNDFDDYEGITPIECVDRIKHTEEIRQLVRNLATRDRNLEDKHRSDIKELKKHKTEIQAKCNHYSTTYYPDASGNNDSYTECDVCGKELRK